MKTEHEYWTIEELTREIDKIEFPEFQREPTVWDLEKKQKLIDSILRDFDISSLYFYLKDGGGYDCIDGRQRINAILSFLGMNDVDEDDNKFHLRIENEIYDDGGAFNEVDKKRYEKLPPKWRDKIRKYKLNIVKLAGAKHDDEELNLLFLRLQIASVLNAGEKLHAMTGEMRNWIFIDMIDHDYIKKIKLSNKRYAREQVAAQIVLNVFSKRDNNAFQRSRYIDLQDFFKKYSKLSPTDKATMKEIKITLDKIVKSFGDKLQYVNNRAMAISIPLYAMQLVEEGKEADLKAFGEFFIKLLRTLRWQIPLGVKMHESYYDLLNFQTNVTQATGEKSATQKRHDFLNEYFYFYKESHQIKGDKEYKQKTKKEPDAERHKVKLKT